MYLLLLVALEIRDGSFFGRMLFCWLPESVRDVAADKREPIIVALVTPYPIMKTDEEVGDDDGMNGCRLPTIKKMERKKLAEYHFCFGTRNKVLFVKSTENSIVAMATNYDTTPSSRYAL